MTDLQIFDPVDYLDEPASVAEYLAAALEDDNPDVFIAALNDVARLRGMKDMSDLTGLGRESLYKAMRPGSKLRFDTVRKIMTALGLQLTVETLSPKVA